MVSIFWFFFWAGLTVLAFTAGVGIRTRLRARLGKPVPRVDDDAIQSIMETGVLAGERDAPLDLEEIDEEERKFWSESWDEPEEW